MPRDYKLYLEDMLEAAQRIQTYTEGMPQEQFEATPQVVDAVLFNLYIIGEAVRNIPDEVREQHANIDWRQINALRNLIAHVYFGVNAQRIWNIVEADVPRLKADVTRILHDEET